jgi:protein tyrosine phosphatase (PTP) superfamily phosphohydrolase (DUF442 family)
MTLVSQFIATVLLFTTLVRGSDPEHSPGPNVNAIASAHLENVFALSDRIYSGSSPMNAEAFVELKELGIETIISVDGARPEIETARKFGLRYIHLPIGYNGTSRSNQVRLIKAAQTASGPIYIHCHHGKHRGPAAAAWVCQTLAGWNHDQAVSWLKRAGTSPDYPRLFEAAATFKKPSQSEIELASSQFPEETERSTLVETMVAIDSTWENLLATKKACFKTAPGQTEVDVSGEAIQLLESYRELARTEEARDKGPDFKRHLESAIKGAEELYRKVKLNSVSGSFDDRQMNDAFEVAAKACSACHKSFRN